MSILGDPVLLSSFYPADINDFLHMFVLIPHPAQGVNRVMVLAICLQNTDMVDFSRVKMASLTDSYDHTVSK